MGMLLRRNRRVPDFTAVVNGKTIESAPKKRSLTKEQKDALKTTNTEMAFKPIGVK